MYALSVRLDLTNDLRSHTSHVRPTNVRFMRWCNTRLARVTIMCAIHQYDQGVSNSFLGNRLGRRNTE